MQKQATSAVFVAALLLCAPAHAAIVVGPDGKPIRRGPGPLVIGDVPAGTCKLPPPDRLVAFNLPPEPKLADAIAWISPIICRPFVVRDPTLAENRRLTMVAPEQMIPKSAMRLFLGALESAGLAVERTGRFARVYEASAEHRRTAEDGTDPLVTVLVRLRDLPPDEQEWLRAQYPCEGCDCLFLHPETETLVITDLRSNVERLLGRPIAR